MRGLWRKNRWICPLTSNLKAWEGSKKLDYIENLVALCRECHEKCHASKEYNEMAKQTHLKNLYK
jgi:hypothetical protein